MRRVDPGCRPAGATMLGEVPADCTNADLFFDGTSEVGCQRAEEAGAFFSRFLTRGAWAGRSRGVIVIAAVRTMGACF
jgi:hypothetical protein